MNTHLHPSLVDALRGRGGRLAATPSQLRCFVYCRKSTEEDSRQVQSIERQRDELREAFERRGDLHIVHVYEEARSAKTPGRPLFNEMMDRVEAGEADCLIAWAPDRLARNAVDAGRLLQRLDEGVLRDLRFKTCSFENNATGKFMLSVLLGQSKYYSDALSDNVRSGNRKKAALGWRPNSVPLGYLHDHPTKSIVADEFYFPLVRRLFELTLTRGYSIRQVTQIANDEWAFRTPAKHKRGGRPLSHATAHRILTNPFYAGYFAVQGQVHQGRHPPMVSPEEFAEVQSIIRRPTRAQGIRHVFPLTGMFRCGACRRAITAERKVNRYGSTYVYYHCSKSGLGPRCSQPSVRAEELEAQLIAWLRRLAFRPNIERRLRSTLEAAATGNAGSLKATRQSVEHALRDARDQASELLGLRLRNVIADAEYVDRRAVLEAEVLRLTRRLEALATPDESVIPLLSDAVSFNNYAADCFQLGDDQLKRQIAQIACSNPTLTDGILSVEAAEWLQQMQQLARCLIVRGRRDALGTCEARLGALIDLLASSPALHRQLDALSAQRGSATGCGRKSPKSPKV